MRPAIALSLALAVTTACAKSRPAVVSTPPAPVVAASAPAPAPAPPDPVAAALAASERAFELGRRAVENGHLGDARLAFDQALDTLLLAPGGARSDPRLAAALDALVDRISAVELDALARGDGFTETASEPASIDSLLSMPPPPETPPAASVAETVREDLASTVHDFPIPQNDRVLGYVEAFQGRLRTFLAEGMSRGAEYMPMIQAVFREEGLPLDLAYVPLVESAFKPTALSRASARGVWQFMRPTARENGLTHDWYIDERADPEKATRAAAKYLKTLHRIFDGDWHLALASYNGGPGRVQRAVKRFGVNDFWRLSATKGRLPRETREYVPMILAAMIIARNPAQYGFDVPEATLTAADVVTVSGPVDLRRIAEWANVPAETIRALNPELRRWTTPVRPNAYELRVPAGTATAVTQAHAATAPDEAASLQYYAVRKGETLLGIARKLRVSRTDLAEANYLRTTARVRPGQKLVVPRAPSPALVARRGDSTSELDAPRRAAPPAQSVTDAAPTTVIYRVRKGDTLFAIARRHGVTIEDLRTWNKLRGSALSVGTRLSIQTTRPAAAQ